jgi:hypothetical protein
MRGPELLCDIVPSVYLLLCLWAFGSTGNKYDNRQELVISR